MERQAGRGVRAALVEQWGKDIAADPDKTGSSSPTPMPMSTSSMPPCATVRREHGALGGPTSDRCSKRRTERHAFADDDRIQFTGSAGSREDRQAGLVNGAVGTIRAIEGDRVTVALDGKPGAPERLVSFVAGDDHAAGEFDQFRHGYAGTIYKGQGRTLDQTYLYHSEHWRSATSYVALTRHREKVTLFVATETARRSRPACPADGAGRR